MSIARDPIVIFGAPRSGTAFLNNLLNAHPEIYITHEIRLFAWTHHALCELTKRDQLLITHREAFSEHATKHFSGIRYWGDKNPNYADAQNSGCLETILRIFPGAKFIHIVRDDRDVVASITRRRHADHTPWASLQDAVRTWRDHTAIGSAFAREYGRDICLEIRYENLVAGGLRWAQDIFDFLGIPFHPAGRDFCLKEQAQRSMFSSPARNFSEGDFLRSEWNEVLPDSDRALALDILHPGLLELGYDSKVSALF